MFIKLDIQGELEEYLKEESKSQFRSCRQQVMYILTSYYEGRNNCTQNEVDSSDKAMEDTIDVSFEPSTTDKKERSNENVKNSVDEYQNDVAENNLVMNSGIDDIGDIDDILNF